MDKIAIVVLDGFGVANAGPSNAISQAHMPALTALQARYPSTTITSSGQAVGLMSGAVGNSEVGHLTLGAGAIVPSVQRQLSAMTATTVFEVLPGLRTHLERCRDKQIALHLVGMVSSGGVHSHTDHLHAIAQAAKNIGVQGIYLHAILDGRDVPAHTAAQYLQAFEDLDVGVIASLHGRYYAMDRDNNHDRTMASYQVMVGTQRAATSWRAALAAHGQTSEEFLAPQIIDQQGCIAAGDTVLFFNVRPDRMRQITHLIANPANDIPVRPGTMLTLGHYSEQLDGWGVEVLVQPAVPATTLLNQVAQQLPNHRVLCCAESEKQAHVSYFFDGRSDHLRPNHHRIIIPSRTDVTPDQAPAMRAAQITAQVLEEMSSHDLFVINYANADMVGHTSSLAPTITACEVLDAQLAILHEELVIKRGGTLIITADHGNAELMIDAQGRRCTAHTANPVPLVICRSALRSKSIAPGTWGLSNVAPLVLQLLGCQIPTAMNKPIQIID